MSHRFSCLHKRSCRWRVPLVALVALASCGGQPKEAPSAETQASVAACQCYEALYNGQLTTFLDSRVGAAEMSQEYRLQLLQAYQHHTAQVERTHKGVRNVTANRAVMDTTLQLMQVFLMFDYNDGASEEVVVPMVESNGRWMLK